MIEKLSGGIEEIVSSFSNLPVAKEFLERARQGQLTRDENPYTHFSVFFAGFDQKRQIFIFLMEGILTGVKYQNKHSKEKLMKNGVLS